MKIFQQDFVTPWKYKIKATGREDTNDMNTLISCLNEDEYRIDRLPVIKNLHPDQIAIDLGAHIGGCSLALAARGYKTYAVEMLPENIDLIKENIKLNNFEGQIIPMRAAITGAPIANMTAYYSDTRVEAGRVHEFIGTTIMGKSPGSTGTNGRSIEVAALSLEHLFKMHKIDRCDFLKIDIEGAEWEVVKNTPASVLNKVKRIAVEIEGLEEIVSTSDFLKLLPEGFEDVSKDYFPDWCDPNFIVHGYFINNNLK